MRDATRRWNDRKSSGTPRSPDTKAASRVARHEASRHARAWNVDEEEEEEEERRRVDDKAVGDLMTTSKEPAIAKKGHEASTQGGEGGSNQRDVNSAG